VYGSLPPVQEHLILVCELLRANLYEFQKYQRDNGDEPYFTLPRIQKIAIQVLRSLAFLHGLGLVHSDLKPENILIKSYSRWGGGVVCWAEAAGAWD
jgi:serine/threonine protein kinase